MQPASIDEIKQALKDDAFRFFYQPKTSFVTGRITGGEALIRWLKPDGSIVPPGLFIPVAEACGFITEITHHMFPRLLADYQVIAGVTPQGQVAFNVSGSDLEQAALGSAIEAAFDSETIPAKGLSIEVTEATALSSTATGRSWVEKMARRGVDLALDDFGTGYATLDAIRQLPFSVLKVDQGIVRSMLSSPRSASLVHGNILLAQTLGMKTVAEGIETEEIYDALLHSGCREGQGYWMSRPLPLEQYLTLLRSGRTWPCSHVGALRAALMSQVIELREVMDSVYRKRITPGGDDETRLSRGHRSAFSIWYEGDGRALQGLRAYDSMRIPATMLDEVHAHVAERVAAGVDAPQLGDSLAKLAHYSVVLIGDLLRLESELLLKELKREPK